MSQDDPLRRLAALSNLILDGRLAELRRRAAARAESEAQIAGLERPQMADRNLEGAAAALAEIGYQRWADARRAELNRVLARQTAEWLEATDAARQAFGRNEALATLARRTAEAKRR